MTWRRSLAQPPSLKAKAALGVKVLPIPVIRGFANNTMLMHAA